ncbi:MAG: hypothetical protein NTV81_00820 [Candidatus Komeilibacteria bacterium]|nr:hypothetical protein [Candidatus Komeilibacteria bacterium]
MIQDLVVVAPENVFWADLEETIKKASSLVAAVTLFDVFPWADHKKSLGFRLTLQALDRTLTMEEVEKIKAKLLAILEKEHQAIGR